MTDYDDLIDDEPSYVAWLLKTCDTDELRSRVGLILEHAGVGASAEFLDNLGDSPVDLADYIGKHAELRDDEGWAAEVERRCGESPHPALTAAQRNGAMVSWGAVG